jgi:hypothetical protein
VGSTADLGVAVLQPFQQNQPHLAILVGELFVFVEDVGLTRLFLNRYSNITNFGCEPQLSWSSLWLISKDEVFPCGHGAMRRGAVSHARDRWDRWDPQMDC